MKAVLKNKSCVIGLILIILLIFVALFAPMLTSHPPFEIYPEFLRFPPFWSEGSNPQFILGTDDVGRDIFSRLIFGTRTSLGLGISITLGACTLGVILGLFSGFFGGRVDWFIMRFIDVLMALPSILLAIVIVSVLGPGLDNTVFAVSLVMLPSFTRIVRASVLVEKKKNYFQSSQLCGASSLRIMFLEILPNCMAPLIIQISLGLSEGILATAALGFLGLGAQPPTAEWGTMLADARSFIETAPWLVTLPGLCILFCVLGFNLLGDGLRDILDPHLREEH